MKNDTIITCDVFVLSGNHWVWITEEVAEVVKVQRDWNESAYTAIRYLLQTLSNMNVIN